MDVGGSGRPFSANEGIKADVEGMVTWICHREQPEVILTANQDEGGIRTRFPTFPS